MSGDIFIENITIIDEWQVREDRYRLVNLGAGPDRLQTLVPYYDSNKLSFKDVWRDEKDWYSTAILIRRIKELKKENDFLIEERDQIIVDKNNLIKNIK